MLTSSGLTLVIFLLICILGNLKAYKLLCIQHGVSKSHHIVASSLFKGLAAAGHDVTVLSAFALAQPMQNYNHRETPSGLKQFSAANKASLLLMVNSSLFDNAVRIHQNGIRSTERFFRESAVQELLKSDRKFDAVIFEVFLAEALYGFAEHFKAPLIGLSTIGATTWNTDMVGSPSPPSYVPSVFLPLTEHMSLVQRIGNLAYLTFERILFDWWYLPQQSAIYRKYFPHLKRSMYEVRRDTALVLLNHHVSLGFARPYVPNQIEVGGMHINEQRKPLPENIQQFIEEAKHGVVYFSMGSNIESKNLPPEKRQAIMDTFRGLKQRVLWKFEDTTLEGKPDNVMISAWFPQDDILAHPNVKLFVTHGGLLSTTESIYHGKPVVGIPMFGDQFINMALAEAQGCGITLDYLTLTKEMFAAAIGKVLDNSNYSNRVQQMSKHFHDRDLKPLDKAVYWVEHVVRHKGADYLRNAGQQLNFIQYHNIDAMLILYGGLFTIFIAILLLMKHAATFLFRGRITRKLKNH